MELVVCWAGASSRRMRQASKLAGWLPGRPVGQRTNDPDCVDVTQAQVQAIASESTGQVDLLGRAGQGGGRRQQECHTVRAGLAH